MHLSSLDKMKAFVETYLEDKRQVALRILDLGSSAIGGCYRDLFVNDHWQYTGVDLSPGENVDLVLADPYNWLEIESESVDILVSGQTFEHIEYFWRTMREIGRVVKPGGICCIIAPSRGPEHKYPVDCWRFYPDGFRALARLVNFIPLDVTNQAEALGYPDGSDEWGDTVLVARKPLSVQTVETDNAHVYRRNNRTDEADALSKIKAHIKPESEILELGPATGYLTAYLKNDLGCRVDCVELSPAMAAEARQYCDKMVVADLDTIDLTDHFQAESYDFIILADVLEHLKNGEKTLNGCRRLLKKDGQCLISVPNIAHAAVVGRLMQGRFDYTPEGLLDNTHLHFYTRQSITALLRHCGFAIRNIEALIKLPEDTEIGDALLDLPHAVQNEIYRHPDALSYQFVICCDLSSSEMNESVNHPATSLAVLADLRKATLASLNERIAELTDLSTHRMNRIVALEDRISKENEALRHAQQLAWERLDQLTALEDHVRRIQWQLEMLENKRWVKAGKRVEGLVRTAVGKVHGHRPI